MQKSDAVANAQLDAIEIIIGTSAIIKFFEGTKPATTALADNGTVIATLPLPSDYFSAAASRSKAKLGTWQDTAADAATTGAGISYWRMYASDGTTCHLQGTATITGGGGEVTLDSVAVSVGQNIQITSFTITSGN